jgi:hypothetical protein
MQRCKRCNKPLKDKESIERGYGPGCWEKVQAGDLVIEYRQLKPVVYDPIKATEARFKLEEKINVLNQTCHCGEPIKNGTLKSYNCATGKKVPGYKYPQWFYSHCEKCGYDTAIWKLNIEVGDIECLI